MHELTDNLHMHTTYSDGSGTHADLGAAALRTGIDVLLVTDHNVWVQGVDTYFREGRRRVLLVAGEEIHDQGRDPQKNHLLVFGANRELATLADDPQTLIDAVRQAGGLCFLAHPYEAALPAFGETDITWENWEVMGFTGIELWNGFSEFKTVVKGKLGAVFHAFFPEALPHGPLPETLQRWDSLLAEGRRVVAVGGSDAHALHLSMGPLRRTVYPYEYHFSTVNTHILTPSPLTGDLEADRNMVLDALRLGHCFVGNDLPARTNGFRFSAQGKGNTVLMGDAIPADGSVTLQAKLPVPAEISLIRNGKRIKSLRGAALTCITDEPGVYRIEVRKVFLGRSRGWIYSNPIYVTEKAEAARS